MSLACGPLASELLHSRLCPTFFTEHKFYGAVAPPSLQNL